MTYLDAAFKVLSEAHQPLHYSEITSRAMAQHLLQPTGVTPDATMGARLYTDTQQEDSRFVRIGKGWFDLAKQRPGGIEEQVQQINQRTREQLHELLLAMPAKRFESLIMELLLKMGFDETTLQVTPFSNDGGIDVIGVYRAAGLTEVNAAVQAKRWKGNVGAPTVTQLRGSLQVHQQGIIITTSGFSSGARKEAVALGKTRIALIDGRELVELLIKHRVGALEKRLLVDAIDEEWWGEILSTPAAAAAPPPKPHPAPVEVTPPEPAVTPAAALTPAPTLVLAEPLESIEEPVTQQPTLIEEPELPEPSPEPPPDVDRTNDLPTGRKPASVTLLGQHAAVKSWASLLVFVCQRLAELHHDEFAAVVTATHGRKRKYLAESGDGMIAAKSIPGTQLYVETNLSAKDVMRLIGVLLEDFGYTDDALDVEYAAGKPVI
ncbi:MAG: restriction endonuclease [Caldilineaceae bacterium]